MSKSNNDVLLICGSRTYSKFHIVFRALQKRNETATVTRVAQGGAPGADTHARVAAETLRIDTVTYPARWELHGREAGPIRNQQMLENEPVDEVWAFVTGGADRLQESRGTYDMCRQAARAGKSVRVYGEDDLNFRWAFWENGELVIEREGEGVARAECALRRTPQQPARVNKILGDGWRQKLVPGDRGFDDNVRKSRPLGDE